jgi:hypothetical protein
MQHAAAGMTVVAVQMTDLAVGIVHEYERLGIEHDIAPAGRRRPNLIRQETYSARPKGTCTVRTMIPPKPTRHTRMLPA